MERLVELVLENADRVCRREEDRALNESRRVVQAAEDRVQELERAARELGRVRGAAAERALEGDADREIERLRAGAFDALYERFCRRVVLALDHLPGTEAYGEALRGWALDASEAMDGPAEVFCAARDREAVYDALLAADARDFHVRVDRKTNTGFVVRDLEGRVVLDRRPQAIVAERGAELREMLSAGVPAFDPTGAAEGPHPEDA